MNHIQVDRIWVRVLVNRIWCRQLPLDCICADLCVHVVCDLRLQTRGGDSIYAARCTVHVHACACNNAPFHARTVYLFSLSSASVLSCLSVGWLNTMTL